eukprot:COSAG02_NODE_101_length_36804_cov_125.342951_8_plen_212_part_00
MPRSRARRPGSFSPPPPFTLRTAATTQGVTQGSKQTVSPHSGRVERPAARGGVGEGGGGALEQQLRRWRGREADRLRGAEKHRLPTNRASTSHLELAARAVVEARAGEDPRKASHWAVMCAKRRQFEREHAEDLRRSAIFIKYTVGCFSGESIQSINRDDVAICRSFAACQSFSQPFQSVPREQKTKPPRGDLIRIRSCLMLWEKSLGLAS